MSYNIIGDSLSVVTKTISDTGVMQVYGNDLKFNQGINLTSLTTNSINSDGNNNIEINRNGTNMVTIGNAYIDFHGQEVRNLTTSTVSELSGDLTINDSLQIGNASGAIIKGTGALGNLQIGVPSSRQINLAVNNVAQAYVDGNGLNIPSGSLYIAGNGFSISQNTGSGIYKAPTGQSHKMQVNNADVLTVSGTTLTSLNTTNVFGSGQGGALTMTHDANTTLYDVPTSKEHRFRIAGSSKYGIASALTTSYNPMSITDATDSSSVSTGCLYTSGGVGVGKKLFVNGSAGSGSVFSVDNAFGTNDPTATIAAGSTSNSHAALRMKPNYTGSVLNGFQTYVEYGDNATGGNRLNSTLFLQQYMDSFNGGAAINAYETRLSYGARREVRFSTTGSGTNDIVFDGTNATFTGVNVSIGSGKSLTLASDLASKPSTNTWTISSDSRLKQNLSELSTKTALSTINKIKVKQFEYIPEFIQKYHLTDNQKIGVLAQDLEQDELLSRCVFTGEDEVFYDEKDDEEKYVDDITGETKTRYIQKEKLRINNKKSVNMDRVYYMLIGAVQELSKQNQYIMNKLHETIAANTELQNKLNELEQTYVSHNDNNKPADVFENTSYSVKSVSLSSML
jgi:hypothetical protein